VALQAARDEKKPEPSHEGHGPQDTDGEEENTGHGLPFWMIASAAG
jgi:hypothetical protein